MLNKKRNKGFTLLESILALSIFGIMLTGGLKVTSDFVKDANIDNHANLPLKIIKAVDRRVEIDGYGFSLWSGLPQGLNTDEVLEFAEKAFISRYNNECGRSDGWEPVIEESRNEKLVPCNIKEQEFRYYDFQIKMDQNNEGSLMNFDIIMRLNSEFNMIDDKLLNNHKSVLNKLKSDQPDLKAGSFLARFSNFNDLTQEISVSDCSLLGNDCVIKASWVSDGYSESLRLDGTNNMIKDTISFSEHYYSANLECLLWEYDDNGNYVLNNTADCGIGVYNKTLKPVLATVDANVKDTSFFEPIILKEMCIKYEQDANGYLVANGTTECGLFTGENGTKKVIQVVEKMQADAAYQYSNGSMIVDKLISKDVNTSVLNISNSLLVDETNSETNFNILVVENGAETVLNGVTTLKILENLTKTEFQSDVSIVDNTTLSNPSLSIDGSVNIESKLNSSYGLNTVSNNLTSENVEAGSLNLKVNNAINNGDACVYTDEGKLSFDGKNVLTCRETLTNGIFRWLSNRFGEIAQFNGSCPTGWVEFNDANGRTLMGSGRVFDPILGDIEYQVGNKGGKATVKLTESQMPNHSHNYKDAYFSEHWGWEGPRNQPGKKGGQDNDNNLYTMSRTSNPVGGSKEHENMMSYKTTKTCMYQEGDKATENFPPPSTNPDDHWYPYPSELGDWVQKGVGYNCSPDQYTDLRPEGDIEYWVRDCVQDYERSIREREINYLSGQKRYTGIIDYESKTERTNEVWVRGTTLYLDWYDISEPYECSYPQVNTNEITGGYSLTLYCKVMRERLYQERLAIVDSNGNEIQYRNYGEEQKDQAEFSDNYVFFVSDSDVFKQCSSWKVDPIENTKPWTPDAANYERYETVDQSRVIEEFRNCDHMVNLEGHKYKVDDSIETRNVTQSRTINGSKINLKSWLTYDTNGIWSIASDGSYVNQTKNGNPTIFESPTKDYGKGAGSVFKGWISVGNDGDDDYIGFVVGKRDLNNFYLWSWKKNNQGVGKRGHTLAKVTGGVNVIGWDTHVSKSGYTVLDTDLKDGWVYNKKYEFRIEYKRNNIRIFIDGKLLFDVDGNFPEGGVGFYNNSQSKVSYYKITEEPYYE